MSVERFEHTAKLDGDALQALLASGRPEQRVWAAWQIALRVGAMPQIVQHVIGEPAPGVRRALLVVLAGHGELDVLVALARHDPAIAVRSHAMQLVTALAAQGAIALAVVREAFASGPTEIRCAILRGIPAAAPAELAALVDDALARGTAEEQLEAFEIVLNSERRALAMRWLAAQSLSAAAWQCVQRLAPAEIIALLRSSTPAMRAHALRSLTRIPIAELADLIVEGEPVFEAVYGRPDIASAPPEVLARGILSGFGHLYAWRLTPRLSAMTSVPAALVEPLHRLRAQLRSLLVAIHHGRPSRPSLTRQDALQLLGQVERLSR